MIRPTSVMVFILKTLIDMLFLFDPRITHTVIKKGISYIYSAAVVRIKVAYRGGGLMLLLLARLLIRVLRLIGSV